MALEAVKRHGRKSGFHNPQVMHYRNTASRHLRPQTEIKRLYGWAGHDTAGSHCSPRNATSHAHRHCSSRAVGLTPGIKEVDCEWIRLQIQIRSSCRSAAVTSVSLLKRLQRKRYTDVPAVIKSTPVCYRCHSPLCKILLCARYILARLIYTMQQVTV